MGLLDDAFQAASQQGRFLRPEEIEKFKALEQQQNDAKVQAEEQRIARNKEQGLDASGRPIRPEFESFINPETGQLESNLQLGALERSAADTRGLDAFRDLALREGPSRAAQLQRQQLGTQTAQRLDNAAQQSAAGRAQGLSQLASTGGVSGAARERLGRSSARDLLLSRQDVGRQAQQQGLGISQQDETNRLNLLQQLPGLDLQRAQFQQQQNLAQSDIDRFNVGNLLTERSAKRSRDFDVFKERNAQIAAEKTAEAQRAASGGGGKK